MTLGDAIKRIPDCRDMQPELEMVEKSYRDEGLRVPAQCIYLIAYLLHLVNNPSERP